MKTTMDDQVVEEIREARVSMSKLCGNDPARMVAYLKTYNKKYAREVGRYRKSQKHPAALCPA
jgi:hypothetical protein